MRYISTRGSAPVLSFEEAMLTGLARDGGLYVPETIPTLSAEQIAAMQGQSYEEVAFTIMRPFIGDTFTDEEFRAIIARAYAGFGHTARAPMVRAGMRTVLSDGSNSFEPLKSPIPVTVTCLGTSIPARLSACSAPQASTSLPQMIAVGRSPSAISASTALFAVATL